MIWQIWGCNRQQRPLYRRGIGDVYLGGARLYQRGIICRSSQKERCSNERRDLISGEECIDSGTASRFCKCDTSAFASPRETDFVRRNGHVPCHGLFPRLAKSALTASTSIGRDMKIFRHPVYVTGRSDPLCVGVLVAQCQPEILFGALRRLAGHMPVPLGRRSHHSRSPQRMKERLVDAPAPPCRNVLRFPINSRMVCSCWADHSFPRLH